MPSNAAAQDSGSSANRTSPSIKILVSTHKPTKLFDSAIMKPIQVGSARAATRLENMLHDDEGENISELNPHYSELTAQYWAWKNLDADYYGFCHYRRYFNLSGQRYDENDWGEVLELSLDAAAQEIYGLTDENITNVVTQYDLITTDNKVLSKYDLNGATPFETWHNASSLYDEDLLNALAILVEKHPDYEEDVEAYLNGDRSRFCNMYIMRRDIFHDYCAWMFPILEEFTATLDMSLYSRESRRITGHVSERMLNIYIEHHMRTGAGWRIHEVQSVFFENTDPDDLKPITADEASNKPVVPIVLAADRYYLPMLTTTIHSMLKNASDRFFYHIVVFTGWIAPENKQVVLNFFAKYGNAKLEFVNVAAGLSRMTLTTNNEHISAETYYRFLIQEMLPFYDKVIYLDSDLIVQADISELYATELGDNLIGAVIDSDYLGNLNMSDGQRLEYTKTVLRMKDPYKYFQAGVLVLNTAALRNEIPIDVWFDAAQDSKYIYNDQDILNEYCEGRVTYLDTSWNVMNDGCNRILNAISHAPLAVYEDYLEARKHEKIIHYAGYEKPWKSSRCDRGTTFWEYARETPYYEELLVRLTKSMTEDPEFQSVLAPMPESRAISEGNPLRRVIDPLLPEGSKRREAIRQAVLRLRGVKE